MSLWANPGTGRGCPRSGWFGSVMLSIIRMGESKGNNLVGCRRWKIGMERATTDETPGRTCRVPDLFSGLLLCDLIHRADLLADQHWGAALGAGEEHKLSVPITATASLAPQFPKWQ